MYLRKFDFNSNFIVQVVLDITCLLNVKIRFLKFLQTTTNYKLDRVYTCVSRLGTQFIKLSQIFLGSFKFLNSQESLSHDLTLT